MEAWLERVRAQPALREAWAHDRELPGRRAAVEPTLPAGYEPLAAVLFAAVVGDTSPYVIDAMLAGVAGIMVLVTIQELMPTALTYISPTQSAVSNMIGMALMAVSISWLHGQLPHDHGGHDHHHHHEHDHGHHHHHHA